MIDFLKFAFKESALLFKFLGVVTGCLGYIFLGAYFVATGKGWATVPLTLGLIVAVWLYIMLGKYKEAQIAAAKAVAEKLAYESTRERIVAAGSLFPAAAKPVTKPPLTNSQILAQIKSGKYP